MLDDFQYVSKPNKIELGHIKEMFKFVQNETSFCAFCARCLLQCIISQIIKQPKVHSPCVGQQFISKMCQMFFFVSQNTFKVPPSLVGTKINKQVICLHVNFSLLSFIHYIQLDFCSYKCKNILVIVKNTHRLDSTLIDLFFLENRAL